MQTIYRKSSLEKLSSPEQLDKMIHITKTSGWIALLGMFLIILAAGYWAFFGEISEKISAEGIYLDQAKNTVTDNTEVLNGKDTLRVFCYVPLSTGKKIQAGMKVNILPSTVNEQETGYLLGQVVKVGDYGISEKELQEKLGDDLLVQAFRREDATEPVLEVEIQLSTDDNTKSGFAWSNKKGEDAVLSDFTLVEAFIIAKTMTPFQKFTSSIF